jgi:hypothetical protein
VSEINRTLKQSISADALYGKIRWPEKLKVNIQLPCLLFVICGRNMQDFFTLAVAQRRLKYHVTHDSEKRGDSSAPTPNFTYQSFISYPH